MLHSAEVIAFVATVNPADAKSFYADVLGLRLVEETPFALEFDANGTTLRIAIVGSLSPAQHTVLGWRVVDIGTAVDKLASRGIEFKRFDGIPQNDRGVWQSPAGSKVAWFQDPDGNTLSLTEI